MDKPFRPMLAAEADLSKLRFPLIASPKLDGVRALVRGGVVLSRALKPIPNRHVQELFGRPELEGLDGELIVGPPSAPDVYRTTVSAVMRGDGHPPVYFHVFDTVSIGNYAGRLEDAAGWVRCVRHLALPIRLHEAYTVSCLAALEEYEREVLAQGYEGLILRDPEGPYKFGRSTAKEGYLLKLKRFQDSEARVLAVEELMHNANEATENELGLTERSSHKANQVPMGTMGALYVEDIHTGQRFRIGTGFTQEDRAWWWGHRHPEGLLVKYKFFPVGVKDLPRHPSYLGLRDPDDL